METIKHSTPARAIPPTKHLKCFEMWLDDVQLTCWLDYERGDRSVGLNASAWLYHAYVGGSGMDVAELLADHVVERIEAAAAAGIEEESEAR